MKESDSPTGTSARRQSGWRWFRLAIVGGVVLRLVIAPFLSFPFDMSVWFSIWERFWAAGINPFYRTVYGFLPTFLIAANAAPAHFAWETIGVSNVGVLQLSFRLLLLPFDLLACLALRRVARQFGASSLLADSLSVLWFWNPLVIYVTFVHGQLPIAAVSLALLGYAYLGDEKPARAMASFALAICFHYVYVLLAIPALVMALRSRATQGRVGRVVAPAFALMLINFAPLALNASSILNLYSQLGSRTGAVALSIPNWSIWSVMLYLGQPSVASFWPFVFLGLLVAALWRFSRDGLLKRDPVSRPDWVNLTHWATGILMLFLGVWSVVEPQSMLLGLPFLFLLSAVDKSKRWLYAATLVSVVDLAVMYSYISPGLFLLNVLPPNDSLPSFLSTAPDVLLAVLGTLNGAISVAIGAIALFWKPHRRGTPSMRLLPRRKAMTVNGVVSAIAIAVMIAPLPAVLPLLAAGPVPSVSPDLPRLNVLTFESSTVETVGGQQRLQIPIDLASFSSADSWHWEVANLTLLSSGGTASTFVLILDDQCRYTLNYTGPTSVVPVDPRCLASTTTVEVLSGPPVSGAVVTVAFQLSPTRTCCGLEAIMAFAALGVLGLAGVSAWVALGLVRKPSWPADKRPLRVALVCKGPLDSGGGVEECCKLLFRGLDSTAGLHTVVYHWRSGAGGTESRAGKAVVPVPTLHLPGLEELVYSAGVGMRLLLADVDVVHAHGEVGFFPAFVRILRPDLRLVVSYHGLQFGLLRSGSGLFKESGRVETVLGVARCLLVALMETFEGWLCDVAISDSEGVARELRQTGVVAPNKIVVIENIPDVARLSHLAQRAEARKQLGLPETDKLALFIGSDWRRKGLHRALRFTSDCRAAGIPMRLVVVGLPRLPSALSEFSEACIPVGRVAVTDLVAYYAAADFLLLPTAYEGYSMTILESLASGLPVITTRASNLVPNRFPHVYFIEDHPGNSLVQIVPGLTRDLSAADGFPSHLFELSDFVGQHLRVYRSALPVSGGYS